MMLDNTTIFWKPEAIFKAVYLVPIVCKKEGIFPRSYWLPTGIQLSSNKVYCTKLILFLI